MGLFKRGRVSVGLDIGSRFVKAVRIDHAGDAPEVSRIAMRALPEVNGEGFADASVVVDAVVKLFRDTELKSRHIVASVGGHDVIVKRFEMERMDPSELREVIRWEAEQHLPFDTDDVELDFQVISAGDPMEVLLVGARREFLKGRAEVTRAAGLPVQVMDVDGFALCNALVHNHPEVAEGVAVLADVGWRTTQVVVVEDGIPAVTRDFPFGTRSLRDHLQRETGLDRGSADEVVRGRAVSAELKAVIEFGADEIAMGVERASAFLKTRSADVGPGRVYLSGGGARIPGFAQALGSILSVETRVANPFERIAVRPDACVDVRLDDVGPLLLLPVGLGLRAPS